MIESPRIVYRIAVLLALIVFICSVPLAYAEDSNGTVARENTTGISGNSTVTESPPETIPVTTIADGTQNPTLLQTIIPTLTAIISPAPTEIVETTPIETTTVIPTDTLVISPTPTPTTPTTPTLADVTQPVVTITENPVLQQKSLSPSVQRKISTNLLYMIDSNAPQTGLSRDAMQNQMRTEGKLKTVTQATSSEKNGLLGVAATTPASNLVLIYIDLVPTASTSAVDAYVSTVTERNEQDHSVVAWVDIDKLDSLASLDAVSNVRTAEPSVTKNSPVYHDTKFVNKRAGLSPATVDEAKANVRAFENVLGIELEPKQTMKTPRGNAYEMVSDNGRYYVNAKTGEVELASYGYYSNLPVQNLKKSKVRLSEQNQNNDPVTMDGALSTAQDYLIEHYHNFNNRTLVLSTSRLIDHGDAGKTYYFIWIEKINDVLTPNSISVSLNAYNSKIISYIGIDQPLDVNIIPSISRDTATQNAVVQFSPIVVSYTNDRLAILSLDENNQKLVWIVDVRGEPKDGLEMGGDVIIDAHSGAIVEVDRYD